MPMQPGKYLLHAMETRFLNLQSLLSIKKSEDETVQMYTSRAWQLFNKVNSVDYAVKVKIEEGVKVEDPFVISKLVFVLLLLMDSRLSNEF